jgi:DNA uptake protein ComE-like DNA-binding protein
MSWKDYLYIQKGERIAIILLLILIAVSGGIYILTSSAKDREQVADNGSDKEFAAFLENLKDKENPEAISNESYIYKGKTEKPNYPGYVYQEKLKAGETIEINTSDTSELKKIPGIGSGFSNRITKYRDLLGGYTGLNQLQEVYGMDDELYNKITSYLTISPKVRQLRINHITFEELNRHPYISYRQAKVIADIRERKGHIESMNRLSLLDEFTDADIKRLTPYLSFE